MLLPSACLLVSYALAAGQLHVTRIDANGDAISDPQSFKPWEMRSLRLKVRRQFLSCDNKKVPDPYLGVKLFHAGDGCPELSKAISDAHGLPHPGSRLRALFIHCPTGYCSYCEGDCVKLDDSEAGHFCPTCTEEFCPGEGINFPCQRTGHRNHREKVRRCEKCKLNHEPHLPCDTERDSAKLQMREKKRDDRRMEQMEKEAEQQKILENLTAEEQVRYNECLRVVEEIYEVNGHTDLDLTGRSGGYTNTDGEATDRMKKFVARLAEDSD